MSTADIDLLGPPQADDIFNPEFAVVLRGFDPDEVRAYVAQVVERVTSLQQQLDGARGEAEAARRRYAAAKEAAYRQLAGQMTELLHTADKEAERLRRDGAEEADRKVAEAARQADVIHRESEEAADGLQQEGEETLRHARAESDRILGRLGASRDEMLTELENTRQRLDGVVGALTSTIEETKREADAREAIRLAEDAAFAEDQVRSHTELVEPLPGADVEAAPASPASLGDPPVPAAAAERPSKQGRGRQADDLLESVEGFDLVLPDIRLDDEGSTGS